MALGVLSIDIEARLAKLDEGMTRAQRVLERNAAQMERSFASASRAVATLITGLGGVGLTAFARSVINGVDALNDFAEATGTTVENASALEDIAVRTGTSVDTAATAMVRFNAQLANAKAGSDSARIFEQIGLDAAKLRDLDPAEALLQTAKALGQYADDGNKARLVQELFGKSVREVAPFLRDLAEAGTLNAKVTTEQAKAAEDFNKAIHGLQKDLTDLARSLLSSVIPGLQQFVRELRAGVEAFGGFGAALANLGTDSPGSATGKLLEYREKLAQVRAELEKVRGGEFRLDFGGMGRNALADLEAQEERLRKFVTYYEKVLGITGVAGGRGSIVPTGGRPSVGVIPDKAKEAKAEKGLPIGVDMPPALAEALKRIEDADEAKLNRVRDTLAELTRLVGQGVSVPSSVFADLADEMARLDPAARAAADAQKELDKAVQDGRRIFEETRTPAEALAIEIERLNKLLAQGAIDWDTYARAQFAAQDRFDEAVAKAKAGTDKLDETARDLGMTFSSAFEDAIVNGERFSAVLKGIERDIVRIITRNLVTQPAGDAISKWLSEGIKAGATGSGSSGAGFDWAKLIGSLFSGWFAGGGYIPPGRWGVVGERGPEPAYGGRTGMTVRPGGGSTVVVNVNGAAGASRMAMQQQAELVGREVMLALNRNG